MIINHPLRLLIVSKTKQAKPFAPLSLQEFHHYYDLVRHRNLTVSPRRRSLRLQFRFPVFLTKA